MNLNSNSIKLGPALLSGAPTRALEQTVISVSFTSPALAIKASARPQRCPRSVTHLYRHRTSEFWENLSFVTLWVCGLIALGLCLL